MTQSQTEPDRYLDSSRVLRELEEAERGHQLDGQGVLDELGKAALHCERVGNEHQSAADAYMLARAAYFAEVQRRTRLTSSEACSRANARQWGNPDPIEKKGFDWWCRENGINPSVARAQARLGQAPDPAAALYTQRKRNRDNLARAQERTNVAAQQAGVKSGGGSGNLDPLRRLKIEWYRLSPMQRQAALDWIMETDKTTFYAEAAD